MSTQLACALETEGQGGATARACLLVMQEGVAQPCSQPLKPGSSSLLHNADTMPAPGVADLVRCESQNRSRKTCVLKGGYILVSP